MKKFSVCSACITFFLFACDDGSDETCEGIPCIDFDNEDPSFSTDIVPLIRLDCASCHRGGQFGIQLDGELTDYPHVIDFVDLEEPEATDGFLWWAAGGTNAAFHEFWTEESQEYVLFYHWVINGAENN